MRAGEATALRWRDRDLQAGALQIRDSVKRRTGKGLVVGDVKTPCSRRHIMLATGTVDAQRIHQQRQTFARRIAEDAWTDIDLVFCTATGDPLDAGAVSHAKDRALAACALPHVRTHGLYHTAATYL